ncbi:hypothetical protein AVEN_178659-1, partial [Araneus ventricosus]
ASTIVLAAARIRGGSSLVSVYGSVYSDLETKTHFKPRLPGDSGSEDHELEIQFYRNST